MDNTFFSDIVKQLFKSQSNKYAKKLPKDIIFCHFCKKNYQRSGKSCHDSTNIHKENVAKVRESFIEFMDTHIYGKESFSRKNLVEKLSNNTDDNESDVSEDKSFEQITTIE